MARNDRAKLAHQISIINKYSPRILAFDFFLVPDSLTTDNGLVEAFKNSKNTVQCIGLYRYNNLLHYWDSLDISNAKFKTGDQGFSNLNITEDSVLIPELVMVEYYRYKKYHPLSYVIAENSFGVKKKYKNHDPDRYIPFSLVKIGRFFKVLTYSDMVKGNFEEKDFKDKIVIMGYVGHREDLFYLDTAKTRKISGVEIHASFVNELIDIED